MTATVDAMVRVRDLVAYNVTRIRRSRLKPLQAGIDLREHSFHPGSIDFLCRAADGLGAKFHRLFGEADRNAYMGEGVGPSGQRRRP